MNFVSKYWLFDLVKIWDKNYLILGNYVCSDSIGNGLGRRGGGRRWRKFKNYVWLVKSVLDRIIVFVLWDLVEMVSIIVI